MYLVYSYNYRFSFYGFDDIIYHHVSHNCLTIDNHLHNCFLSIFTFYKARHFKTSTILVSDMKHRSKVLLNKDFLSILRPFYILDTIVCVRKFNISINYVENISRKNIMCAIMFHCVMSCLYFINVKYTNFSIISYKMIYNIAYFEYVLNFSVVCINNLLYSSTSVRLLSVLNEINSCLYSPKDLKKFRMISWGVTTFLLLCCVMLVALKLVFDPSWTLLRGVYVSTSIILDLEVARTMVLIFMLACKTEKWNNYVENINFGNDNDAITLDREAALEEMYHALMSVHEAWNLIKKTSAFMVSYIITQICNCFNHIYK